MRRSRKEHAFTLIELVLSVAISAILMSGIASAVLLATRAADLEESPGAQVPQTVDVLGTITADLRFALNFTERTASSIEFTVPDRNADGNPELIRYAWSGVAGDPLTRAYNNGAPETLASDVQQFDLSYLLRTITPAAVRQIESAELELISHDDAPGGVIVQKAISAIKWAGQYFKPTLPTNTVSWKINRVLVRLSKSGPPKGSVRMWITEADANLQPTTTVLDELIVPEGNLGAMQWQEFAFGAAGGLDPAQGYCIVVTGYGAAGGTHGLLEYETGGVPMTANTHYMTSDSGVLVWSAPNDTDDMRFFVYGTVTTTGPPIWP